MFYDLPWLCIYNGRRESRKCQGHKLPHISKTKSCNPLCVFYLYNNGEAVKTFFRKFSLFLCLKYTIFFLEK